MTNDKIRKIALESIETKLKFFDSNAELVGRAADLIVDSLA